MKLVVRYFLCVCLALPTVSSAAIITLTPASPTLTVGAPVELELGITGLGDGAAPSLGAYFIELAFDETILALDSITPSAFLGDTDPAAFETDIFFDSGPGFASIDVFSFLFDFELDALQPADFSLATFSFLSLDTGTSAVTVSDFDFSTATGDVLTPSTFGMASVEVEPDTSNSVPLPASIVLVALGLALVPRRVRRSQTLTV